jgi:hypothetical protein
VSADNGIYILETAGPEYRVIYAQAIDNIYGKFNDETAHWEGDMNMIVDYFRNAEIFSKYEKALEYAIHLSKDYNYLEYGICNIDDFKDRHFGV